MDTYRITIVCLGNICRSPMAATVINERLREAGLEHRALAESAGLIGLHSGKGVDERARQALARRGYPIEHRARVLRPEWLAGSQLVLAADRQNLAELRDLARTDEAVERTRLLRSFDPALTYLPEDDPGLDVPDPFGGQAAEFDIVLSMIEAAAGGVVDHVRLDLLRLGH